jgi:hypothetical protein
MNKILQATYRDGNLILEERLDSILEGKKLTLILVNSEPMENNLEGRKQKFLDWEKQYSAQLPADYQFDREEAHER